MGAPHTEATCPFGISLQCLYCKEWGHTINDCPNSRLYLPVGRAEEQRLLALPRLTEMPGIALPSDSDDESDELSPFRIEQIRRQKEIDDANIAGFGDLRSATFKSTKLTKAEKTKFLKEVSDKYNDYLVKSEARMALLLRGKKIEEILGT